MASGMSLRKAAHKAILNGEQYIRSSKSPSPSTSDKTTPANGPDSCNKPRLLEYSELPDWYREDPHILTSYRPVSRSIYKSLMSLSYIHNVCKPHIVHRDIKSSNTLLDKEFKARVATTVTSTM